VLENSDNTSLLILILPTRHFYPFIKEIIHHGFYLSIVGNDTSSYFCLGQERSSTKKGKQCYTEYEVISKLQLFVHSIFVKLGGRICTQIIGIPMGTNCATFLLICSYSLIRQDLNKNKRNAKAKVINLTFRYTDDALSINLPNSINIYTEDLR